MDDRPAPGSLIADLGRLQTPAGLVAIYRAASPLAAYEVRFERIYVAAVLEPSSAYNGPVAAMIVTAYDERDADEDERTFGVGAWDGSGKQVNNVYAVPAFRLRPSELGATPAVLVGRHLFAVCAFDKHSRHRSERGHQWALEVGGAVPDTTTETAASMPQLFTKGERILQEMEKQGWLRSAPA